MKLKIPKIFAERIEVQNHLNKIGLIETIIYWLIDWRVRKSVNLKRWIAKQVPEPVITYIIEEELPDMNTWTNKQKVRRVLRYVNDNITYTTDISKWNIEEYWQTCLETWTLKTGDCEDGAILLYCILNKLGVPDNLLRVVAGNVSGGGHCYVVFLSDEDGLEYPIDWCYWYTKSYGMKIPYVTRTKYLYSLGEWFSFNATASYKKREYY